MVEIKIDRWIEGIPDADSVRAHESNHPRPDGIRLDRISIGLEYVQCDDRSYGGWLCYHHKSSIEPWVAVIRLKVVDEQVLVGVGFTAWDRLSACSWAKECRYFPVGHDGLPLDYDG